MGIYKTDFNKNTLLIYKKNKLMQLNFCYKFLKDRIL